MKIVPDLQRAKLSIPLASLEWHLGEFNVSLKLRPCVFYKINIQDIHYKVKFNKI
jgi:hypothetical protein